MDKKIIVVLALALVLGIALRSLTARYGVLIDPDDYVYYSVAQQTIAHNLTITSQLSGFPVHNPYNEGPGLIYTAIGFSALTQSLAASMMVLPVLFGALEILVVYALASKLTRNPYAGLLAAFLFAIMAGAIIKNVFGEYRGDSIVPFFLGLSVLLFIYARERRSRALYALSAVPILVSLWMWKGGVYTLAVAGLFLLLMLLERRMKSLWKPAGIAVLLALAGLVLYLLVDNALLGVTSAITAIAELQVPTVSWLVLSLGLGIGLAPIGILIYLLKNSAARRRRTDNTLFLALLSMFLVTLMLQLTAIRWSSLLAMPLAVFTAYALAEFYAPRNGSRRLGLLLLMVVLALSIVTSFFQIPYQEPGNSPNPSFMAAMLWIRNNTAPNATFLSVWSDGSYIEGIGQRTSYSDSLISQTNGWQGFPRFLYAPAGNLTYLHQVAPEYLLVRTLWLEEYQALALEGGLAYNTSLNGTNFQMLESQDNITGLTLVFRNNDTKIYRLDNQTR